MHYCPFLAFLTHHISLNHPVHTSISTRNTVLLVISRASTPEPSALANYCLQFLPYQHTLIIPQSYNNSSVAVI